MEARLPMPPVLARILEETPGLEEAYLVGGCVRDWLLGRVVTDFDVEVYGVAYEELVGRLGRWGRTDLVGRSFGVVKLTPEPGLTFDFTIPRRDSKVGAGHRGFQVALDPSIPLRDAAGRRDFTVNAMMYHPRRVEVLDFFGGRMDLENRVLRHTTAAFVEDPLRVLRGMQFAARFDLVPAPETVALSRSIKDGYVELARERVRDEWFKWARHGGRPSRGLWFLVESGWVDHFPEIKALLGTPQDPEWHPEGDVFVHTCHACDAMAALPAWREADEASRVVYMLAVLAHDLGKPAMTRQAEKSGRMRIVSPGHEELGGELAGQFLERIHAPHAVRERVVPLVTNHLAHLQPVSDRGVRRLARRLQPETIEGLCLVIQADHSGRPPRPAEVPMALQSLRDKARALAVMQAAPRPILMGRHLLGVGMTAGPDFKVLLDGAYEAQLEGGFTDLPGAWRWLEGQELVDLPKETREALASLLDDKKE